MLNVCRAAIIACYEGSKTSFFSAFVILLASSVLIGCSNSVDAVRLNPSPPPLPRTFISNLETQGASPSTQSSTNYRLSIQASGGSTFRTSSASPSFSLTGGIGVD